MSPTRLRILVVGLIFWLLVAWLLATLLYPFDTAQNTLRIFFPGALLLGLLLSFDIRAAEPDVVILRRDFFGTVDEIREGRYLAIPFLMTEIARIPNYPLKVEFDIATIDTQTAKLLRIEHARVRCHYRVSDFRACGKRVLDMAERIRVLEQTDRLTPTDTGLWKKVLETAVVGMVDDKLREHVWQWADQIAGDGSLKVAPPFDEPQIVIENDPYALSLNRTRVASAVLKGTEESARGWGLKVMRIVFETVEVDAELVAKRTRNKQSEITDAQHQGLLDAIALRARGIAEADVRARTVRRILEELVAAKDLPQISEKTVAEIVRAAMYSDGEMIWKGVLEKSLPPGSSASPGTAKTA